MTTNTQRLIILGCIVFTVALTIITIANTRGIYLLHKKDISVGKDIKDIKRYIDDSECSSQTIGSYADMYFCNSDTTTNSINGKINAIMRYFKLNFNKTCVDEVVPTQQEEVFIYTAPVVQGDIE